MDEFHQGPSSRNGRQPAQVVGADGRRLGSGRRPRSRSPGERGRAGLVLLVLAALGGVAAGYLLREDPRWGKPYRAVVGLLDDEAQPAEVVKDETADSGVRVVARSPGGVALEGKGGRILLRGDHTDGDDGEVMTIGETEDGRPKLVIRGKPGEEESLKVKVHGDEDRQTRLRRQRIQQREQRQRAAASAGSAEIVMFYAPWCGACVKARRWLQKNGITYRGRNIDADPTAKARLLTFNPRGSIPTFVVNGKVQVGFSPASLRRAMHR